ncbi:TrkA domain protein [hydrothermal vent metagenome]|uniref:TrkA domain protein n=1 Tax=hydrothermal vent metagenome TaxID=652676 RepID=A0A1W1EHQ4_9ZZZZ
MIKDILILADNPIVKSFLEWTLKEKVIDNRYTIVSLSRDIILDNNRLIYKNIDPTSYNKLLNITKEKSYSSVFILMNSIDDTNYTLSNMRKIDTKIPIFLLDSWGLDYSNEELSNLNIINMKQIISSHLYHKLPNVPLIAQNIGLGDGEIMEVLVPYGSNFAYRHIGSITQRKWKIVAIYRNRKQIIPSAGTMIRPSDTMIIIGRPIVLHGIYKSINERLGEFPNPFGDNIYLILDLSKDIKHAMRYLLEAIYLLDKLNNKILKVRIINATNFALMREIKSYRRDDIDISISYGNKDFQSIIEYDIYENSIGVMLSSVDTINSNNFNKIIYNLKKMLYIFGETPLYNIRNSQILICDNSAYMESVSSSVFDISQTLKLSLNISNYAIEDYILSVDLYPKLLIPT